MRFSAAVVLLLACRRDAPFERVAVRKAGDVGEVGEVGAGGEGEREIWGARRASAERMWIRGC